MSALGRYIVDAVVLERRSPTELARQHGISRRWIHKLVKRFNEGGYASLAPRSHRPHSCSQQTPADVQAQVLELRQELLAGGHDAGPDTIAHHLIGPGRQCAFSRDRVADPQAQRLDHPSAAQATTLLLHPLRGPAAQRDLAGRRHSLAVGRRDRGRDLESARRLLPSRPRLQLLPDCQGPQRRPGLLVAGPDVRIFTDDGELIRALTLDPTRNYQPLGGRWPAHYVLQQAGTMS